MSNRFDVLITPHPDVSYDTINSWMNNHPDYESHYDLEFLTRHNKSLGLFGHNPDLLISLEGIKSADFKYLYGITNSDILLIIPKKPQFSLDKYNNVTVYNEIPNKNTMQQILKKDFGLTKEGISYTTHASSDVSSQIVLSKQIALLSDFSPHMGKYLIDPFLSPDTAPWRLFDAILNGQASSSVDELEVLLFHNNDPMSIFFPMLGYMRNVIVSLDKNNRVLDMKRSNFFKQKARNITDKDGFIQDLSDLSDVIFTVSKDNAAFILKSYVYSLSSRCKKKSGW